MHPSRIGRQWSGQLRPMSTRRLARRRRMQPGGDPGVGDARVTEFRDEAGASSGTAEAAPSERDRPESGEASTGSSIEGSASEPGEAGPAEPVAADQNGGTRPA